MTYNVFIYIACMAGVTFLIRVLPLTLIRREIKKQNAQVVSLLRTIRHACGHDLSGYTQRHSVAHSGGSSARSGYGARLFWQGTVFRCGISMCRGLCDRDVYTSPRLP